MKFRDWKQWVASLPWSLRWFVLLVLFRSSVDLFYFLKEISPLLSPLYIVGVMTPVLIVASFLSNSFPSSNKSVLDTLFGAWGLVVAFSMVALLTIEISFASFQVAIKHLNIVLLFFFFRHLIRSKRDLRGLLTTYLYSTVVPIGMMLYERVIGPLREVVHTRGYDRFEGLYADVGSYAFYTMGAFLIAGYFFLDDESGESYLRRISRMVIVGGATVLGVMSMHHTATWGVSGALLILLLVHVVGTKNISSVVVLLSLCLIGAYYVGPSIEEMVGTALATDMAVLDGEKDARQAFHGRMSRWQKHIGRWEQKSILEKLLGVNMLAREPEYGMIGGAHNDFLRILFLTGIIGLLIYLSFYIPLFMEAFHRSNSERFLILGIIAIFLMYSITTTTSLYFPLLYYGYAIFAYAALPPAEVREPVHAWLRQPAGSRRLRPGRSFHSRRAV